jgi:hypothetical protein
MSLTTNCQIHGLTTDVIKASRNGVRCRLCAYEYHKKWRKKEKNRIKTIQWAKRYQSKHPEVIKKVNLKKKLKMLKNKKERIIKKIMNPSVNCSKHGITTDIRNTGKKNKSGSPMYACRLCHNEYQRNYIHKKMR